VKKERVLKLAQDKKEQAAVRKMEKEQLLKQKRGAKKKKWKKAKKAREAKMMKTGQVRVPEDCSTLKEAVETVDKDDRLTTIVLGKGKHKIDDNSLKIPSAMHIVGDPGVAKEKIVILGGIRFKKMIQGTCHLQHLTLHQAKGRGVHGYSSFTMEDVLVEQCRDDGVVAFGTGVVGRCTNVEVRQCGGSGVSAGDGASITLIGPKTTVHHNCTKGFDSDYGLDVGYYVYLGGFFSTVSTDNLPSTIQLVFPLTKEQVAIDNGGGGNYRQAKKARFYHICQINTIADTSSPASGVASGETKTTSTSSSPPSEWNRKVSTEEYSTLNEAVEKAHDDTGSCLIS
jgi:hypothetical protein